MPLLELDGASWVVVLPRGVVDVLEELGVGAEPEELVGVSSVLELPWGVGDVPLLVLDGVSWVVVLPRGVVLLPIGILLITPGVTVTNTSLQLQVDKT